MIQLTKLNHSAVVLNSDLIKLIEHSPDTVITLTNGEKILVEESAEEVMRRVVQFRRSVREDLYLRPPTRVTTSTHCPIQSPQPGRARVDRNG